MSKVLGTVFGHRQNNSGQDAAATREAKMRRKERELICVFPDKEDIVGDIELELLMMNGYMAVSRCTLEMHLIFS